MPYRISVQEIEAVLKLPSKKRFEYFVKRVVDSEEAWILTGSGGTATVEDGGKTLVALWPFAEFAMACTAGDWRDKRPTSINLDTLEAMLGEARTTDQGVCAFPLPNGIGIPLSAEFVLAALAEESGHY